jgi:hypothetical protein
MKIPCLTFARITDKIVLVDVDAALARSPNGLILLAAIGLQKVRSPLSPGPEQR